MLTGLEHDHPHHHREPERLGGSRRLAYPHPSDVPIHYSHGCWEGAWVIRAWDDTGSEAVATRKAEYGYCE